MKKTIRFPRFDAELDTDACTVVANAVLTLRLRLGLRQLNPPDGARSAMFAEAGKNGVPRKIIRWSRDEWAIWVENFCSSAAAHWRGRFWLSNDGGSFLFYKGSDIWVPNFLCWLEIESTNGFAGNEHATIDVVRLDPSEKFFLSHERLYDNLDTDPVQTGVDSRGNRILQRTHVHEVGHLLGLGHVDVGKPHCPPQGDHNLPVCYGVADADLHSVMGRGMKLGIEHAQPWREALRGFALDEARRHVDQSGTRVATSKLFYMPRCVYAVWPAKMLRVYPRTLAEFKAGVDITSRAVPSA